MSRFSPAVESTLRAAGWAPGRDVSASVSQWERAIPEYQGFAAARRALSEFEGLVVSASGPGISMARIPVELNPTLARGEDDRLLAFQAVGPLFPLGEVENGQHFLAISQEGAVYVVGDAIQRAGSSMEEALGRLICGIALDPVPGGLGRGAGRD